MAETPDGPREMSPECTCDLIEVSLLGKVEYVRGFSRGCLMHPATESERKTLATEAAADARENAEHEAAQQRARRA
jgi:hypothetical protein